uniref:Uncharacterized protein n=1 Tax=Moniliophthora roreri TaxID=221103 RepID=A0A0W0FG40_MONRR
MAKKEKYIAPHRREKQVKNNGSLYLNPEDVIAA